MDIISKKSIILKSTCRSKSAAFQEAANLALELKLIKNADDYVKALNKREEQGSTGLEDGFAIPHGVIPGLKKSAILFIKYQKEIEWETFDGSKVKQAVYFLIPEGSSEPHLKNLSIVSQGLINLEMREVLKNSQSETEILRTFKKMFDFEDEPSTIVNSDSKRIVAVVACPAGLAHTYMAKKAIEVACEELGFNYQVEAHGAMGVENKISDDFIRNSDVFIKATDVGVELNNRFDSLPIYSCGTKQVIKNAKEVINTALSQINTLDKPKKTGDFQTTVKSVEPPKSFKGKMKWFGSEISRHLMTGIGYVIPLVIAASMMIGISRVIASAMGYNDLWAIFNVDGEMAKNPQGILGWLWSLEVMGTKFGLQQLFIPFLVGFICFSIAGKGGLAPGFIIGSICTFKDMGFIGGMFAALFTGYIILFIQKYMKIKGSWASITPILLVPALGTLLSGTFTWFVLGWPFAKLNELLNTSLLKLGNSSAGPLALAAVFSMMIAFDLGGPVNKAAYGVALGFMSEWSAQGGGLDSIYLVPNTAVQLSIILPPLALGIVSIVGKWYYSEELKDAGKGALIMGLIGVSEGAIPFAIKNPIRVTICNVLGCMAAATFAVGMGSINPVQLSAFYAWGFPSKSGFYVLAVFIGVLVIAIPNILLQKFAWHKANGIKFKIFNPKTGFIIFGIKTRNLFSKKANRIEVPLSEQQKALDVIKKEEQSEFKNKSIENY